MTDLGLAHLTALDLPPDRLIAAAARCGYRSIGLRAHPATPGGIAYPTRVGTQAHRDLAARLADAGIRLNEVEFVQLTPDIDVAGFAPMLEAGADLGAASVTVSGDDPDPVRLAATFSRFCRLAGGFGLRVDLEFMRWRAVGSLVAATTIVERAAMPNGAVLVDALHLSRSGGAPADLAPLPAAILRSAQLCDAGPVLPATDAAVIAEAREGRLPPGEGTLPLLSLLAALPADANFAVEMPSADPDPVRRLETAYTAARRLIDSAQPGGDRHVTSLGTGRTRAS